MLSIQQQSRAAHLFRQGYAARQPFCKRSDQHTHCRATDAVPSIAGAGFAAPSGGADQDAVAPGLLWERATADRAGLPPTWGLKVGTPQPTGIASHSQT